MHPFIETQQEYLKDGIPNFRAGDTVRRHVGSLDRIERVMFELHDVGVG